MHLSHYRQLITLPDGIRVCLRPLTPKDRDALIALFANLPQEETQYFRSNVANSEVVASWAEKPDYATIFPLVAVVGDRIVGNSTLHMGKGYTRHVAEIRIFLAKDFRRHGIGSAMIKAQLEVARKLGLHQVIAEIVESQPQVIHAFERLGFERQFAWRDLFMTPQGETLDMVVLINPLRRRTEEF
jgi:RimJ/RimL family protein N-acetyltransferase